MSESFDRERKKIRKQPPGNKNKNKSDISDEEKIVSQSKKAFKLRVREIEEDEIWEEWKRDYT